MSDPKPALTQAEAAAIDFLLSEEGFSVLERGVQCVLESARSPQAQKAAKLVADIRCERIGENMAMDQLAAILRHSDPDL